MKPRIKSNKRRYLIFIGVAILAATVGTLLLSRSMSPYRLQVLQHEGLKQNSQFGTEYILYRDFDKDGFSETVIANNDRENDKYGIAILSFSRFFVDECNYAEPILGDWTEPWLTFGDINKDGYDELFAFTELGDSLFLYIHDLRTKQAIFSRHFLLKTERPHVGNKGGNFILRVGGFIDIENDGGTGFVFAAVSGEQPRGVYIFDMKKGKIVNRFEAEAYPGTLLLYDLTGDGKEEIILTGLAVGNIHYPAKYKDDRCWLFVLDQNLQLILEPLSFGEYSSRLSCSPIEIDSQRFLLLAYWYVGEKNLQDFICLTNSEGKISPKKYLPEGIWGIVNNTHTVPPVLYAATKQANLIKMNEQLNITLTTSISLKRMFLFEGIVPKHLVDLNGDGSLELICGTYEDIQIYDEQLRFLASFPAPSNQGTITFRESGEGNPLEIGLNSGDDFYRFAFEKNIVFSFRPLLGFGLAGFFFLLLAGGYKFSALAYTYLSFFRFSLIKTANGVLILTSTGHISFLNHRVQTLLDLKNPISKRQPFTEAFAEKPQIIDLIQKSIARNRPCQDKISIIEANYQFEGEIRVTPFVSPFKLMSAYLVEFQDYTQPIVSERLQMWSKSVQKIAHDIKTPLSSVALNLKALQMRLQNVPLAEREQLNDDIKMMRSELERVHNMTRSFLKFTNLEKPRFQVVNIRQVVRAAISKFSTFTKENLQIESDLDPKVHDLWADPQQIELVFHILIENAIDALKGKGLIKITTSVAQYLDKSFLRFLEVEVADTGPGIAPQNRDKILEPHFTTKSDGTGMGLAIARKIIEDHGGEIGLYSKPGFGTVIRFSLPLNQDNSSSQS